MRLKALIIGLGQVGLRFDLEKERAAAGIWTHFSAYLQLSQDFEIVAAIDPKRENWDFALSRKPDLKCFESINDFLKSGLIVDIASICTPDAFHIQNAKQILPHVRGLFIEKPFCTPAEIAQAQAFVAQIKTQKKSVRVNYFKRGEPSVLQMLKRIKSGDEIIRHVQCKYSGPFDAVGSHAVDLMQWVSPCTELLGRLAHPHPEGMGWSAFFKSEQGLEALLYTGPRHDLIFELEVVTDKSRFRLSENLQKFETFELKPSLRYKNYSEYFKSAELDLLPNQERFVSDLRELYKEILNPMEVNYKSVDSALKTQDLIFNICTPNR